MRVGMVTNYPPEGAKHTGSKSAVSSYSKNLATAMVLKHNDVELITFVDKLTNRREEYSEENIKVIRCWGSGIFYPFQIFREVLKHRRELDVIHIQHEYFLYGGALTAALFPFMLLLLKCLRKPIVVTLHGVISLSDFGATFAKENDLRGNLHILKFGLSLVTRLICYLVQKVIVHEHNLRQVLFREYGIKREKVAVIHHGIEEGNILIGRGESKEILGLKGKKVVMLFGFLSGYKDLNTLIDAFGILSNNKDYALLIVGGENPRKHRDQEWASYIRFLREKASRSPSEIRLTGFVPEEEIPLYFSAADVVVLPYTRVMSASGPLTQCITYKRPFLLSEPFRAVIDDPALLFENNPEALRDKIEEFFSDKRLMQESLRWGKVLFAECSWNKVGSETYELYHKVALE